MNKLILVIDKKVPTINHIYFNWNNRRILTKEAKLLKKDISEIVIFQKEQQQFKHKNELLKVKVEVHENWYNKNGSVKRKDLDNRVKFLLDSIFNGLEIDDKYLFEINLKKVQNDLEHSFIILEKL